MHRRCELAKPEATQAYVFANSAQAWRVPISPWSKGSLMEGTLLTHMGKGSH